MGRAGFGDFSVNADDLQYTIPPIAKRHIQDQTSLEFGYRYFGIDHETGRSDGIFAYGVDQHGPYFGLTYKF